MLITGYLSVCRRSADCCVGNFQLSVVAYRFSRAAPTVYTARLTKTVHRRFIAETNLYIEAWEVQCFITQPFSLSLH
jgi:hypothetical protein